MTRTPQPPKQLLVLLIRSHDDTPVGKHHTCRDEVVGGEALLALKKGVCAAEHGAHNRDALANGMDGLLAVRIEEGEELVGKDATADGDGLGRTVEDSRVQFAHVDGQAFLDIVDLVREAMAAGDGEKGDVKAVGYFNLEEVSTFLLITLAYRWKQGRVSYRVLNIRFSGHLNDGNVVRVNKRASPPLC